MNKKQKRMLFRIIVAGFLVLVGGLLITVSKNGSETRVVEQYAGIICCLLAYICIGYDILKKAFKGIVNRQPFDENLLMTIATVGAIALADFVEGVAVMLFYQIGEFFQSYAVKKSRKNIAALMDIRPDYANMLVDDEIVVTSPSDVAIGSIIVVKPGEKIPIDGIVVEGESTLDTKALTGESVPRKVIASDEVLSGCINQTGLLKVKTTKDFGESTVTKILELVENASSKKSSKENFISRFARVYTPLVCALAVALAVIPPIVLRIMNLQPMLSVWIYRALTFLVISCPCALVISIPLTFFAGIGGASRAGILIKGSNYMEAISKIKYILMDKTGTLTKGVFEVTEICAHKITEDELIRYSTIAEHYSNHPIASSLRTEYLQRFDTLYDTQLLQDVSECAGQGVKATVGGKCVLVGNEVLMQNNNITVDKIDKAGTVLYVAIDNNYCGYILVSDKIKANSKAAIAMLYKKKINDVAMLTGDSSRVADSVGLELGISHVYSQLLPADKVSIVESYLAKKSADEAVAFVGDGINDAPVLSRVDVGIAMGGVGSDAAIEAADVVLMDDDPMKLPLAITISKKTMRIVYENIYFAIGVKVICLLLGALGVANMWTAIFADVGVMIIAVLNAIRALSVNEKSVSYVE